MNFISKLRDKIALATNWLLHSGIQNLDQGSEIYGSFNAWYDMNKKRFSFAYSEITGYAINTLLYLNRFRANRLLVERAKIGADWLINRAFEPQIGGVLCRFEHGKGEFVSRVCSFDNGVCLNALVNLYKSTGDKKYLDISIRIADWLLKMQRRDGSFYTRYLIKEGVLEENGDKWSKQPGAFQSKISLGLLNLGSLLREDKYISAARKTCDWSASLQMEDGRFITDMNKRGSYLHPICYANEGLIASGIILNEPGYYYAVKKSMEWVLMNKLESNGFPAYFVNGRFVNVESPDINAQVLRLLLIADCLGLIKYDPVDFKQCLGNILAHQCNAKNREARGGFPSGDAWFYGESESNSGKHVNSWVTMFILQTLNMYTEPEDFGKDFIFYLV